MRQCGFGTVVRTRHRVGHLCRHGEVLIQIDATVTNGVGTGDNI